MRCDDLLLRLNAGGPGGLLPSDRDHALGCASCARAIRTTESVEQALRAAPPVPSADFSARILQRVEATQRAHQRFVESRPSAWARWWRAVSEEPVALVALTLAPIALIVALIWPGTAETLYGLARDAATSWIASAWSGTASASSVPALVPAARLVLSALVLPVMIAAFFLGLQQVGEGLLASGGRSVTSDRRAQSESSSRRSAS
jgi:hypothetical protein